MLVMRPADAVEAAECWAFALEHRSGPVSLVFARQSLPLVRQTHEAENLSRRGGYVLQESSIGARQVTLLSTGSEVALCLEARDALQAQGIGTAVVSLPCWELFDAQDDTYKAHVLGANGVKGVRVGVEAAIRQGWDQYLGMHGGFVGMSSFGDSGSKEDLYKHFGITAEAVVAKALKLLAPYKA
jgi:transketolase